jgi:hypothetical protein
MLRVCVSGCSMLAEGTSKCVPAALGEIASARGDQVEAIERSSAASDVARGAGLDRIEVDDSALAFRLPDAGNIATAAAYAKRGTAAARRPRHHLSPAADAGDSR